MEEHEVSGMAMPVEPAPEEALRRELAAAVAAYRQARLAADPLLPPELVVGETVAEIDASVERARAIVAQVRERVRSEAAREVVPAALARTPVDPAALSPREKIAYGLGR
ncbi:MAG: hypothetical protein RMM58_01255 [Chloroflexota bacterium]|nr:hypothetical protein [Dehalococcoidia bacterium]MDW8252486.1 hypothetical protein [Chloroflexota bacterium]